MAPAPDGRPSEMTVLTPDIIDSALTVTAKLEGLGLLVSLKSEGAFSGTVIDHRFYSIAQLPPPGLDPAKFWATILSGISVLLGADDDDDC
jgi:hypothetical protein